MPKEVPESTQVRVEGKVVKRRPRYQMLTPAPKSSGCGPLRRALRMPKEVPESTQVRVEGKVVKRRPRTPSERLRGQPSPLQARRLGLPPPTRLRWLRRNQRSKPRARRPAMRLLHDGARDESPAVGLDDTAAGVHSVDAL
jgi:hypothetical protein